MPDCPPHNIVEAIANAVSSFFVTPVEWFRKSIVEPNQQEYPWYHRRFRRVPTIDQCYTDDSVCIFEADQQYKRDKMVDNEILIILRNRFEECVMYERPDHQKCKALWEEYEKYTANWFQKYGDLTAIHSVKDAYMKQKHRMIWERRHGPVGCGMSEN